MRNILVTGVTGFVGGNIVASLHRTFPIVAPSHKELDLLDAKRVGEYIEKHHVDTVIHCATAGRSDNMELPIRMFLSLAEASSKIKRIIHFGSGAEYDKRRHLIRVKETAFGESIPNDSYGLSKYLISLLAAKRSHILTFRLFGVYGPREDYRIKFISNAIVKHLLGIPIVIKQDVLFDYLYIDDLVQIVRYALTHHLRHAVYNVTPDESITLSDIVSIIQKVGRLEVPVSVATPGYNFQYTGDNGRLRKELPHFRFHTYEEGMGALYQYYRKSRKHLDEKSIRRDEYFTQCIVRK